MMRVLKPGSRYCVTIGNNLIREVRVKSHEILVEIAESSIGFELEKQFFSKLIRHFIRIPRKERMQGEWVLVLFVFWKQKQMEVIITMAIILRWDHVCPALILVSTSFREVSLRAS